MREILQAMLPTLAKMNSLEILSLVSPLFAARRDNKRVDEYKDCRFLCTLSSPEVWGFLVDRKGIIVVACWTNVPVYSPQAIR